MSFVEDTGNASTRMGLKALIREDYRNHFSDWTRPGFRAIAVYRFGFWARGLKPGLKRRILVRLHLTAFRYVRNRYGIEIAATAKIGRRFHIGHQNAIVVHAHASIGDDCKIRQGVTLGVGGLERDIDFSKSGPVIGNRVDIGAGAMIVGKVTIGDDVNIGPNAVVMVNVPANSTVLGPPARILPRPAPAAEGKAHAAGATAPSFSRLN
ncbi:serine acetyltransferase [Agaricicola taiwanensis]|uniref:Serine acetyltransferase n=1 Tax=Agaricicola taiwanensis TaxID=591372 RepID=A0A8J2YG40_9RHOB|nr:serine acetyltransferase [Agaricicola taiwanensis]GGE32459.1 serine acetyltransferase [Agaricicola taiwanensis]